MRRGSPSQDCTTSRSRRIGKEGEPSPLTMVTSSNPHVYKVHQNRTAQIMPITGEHRDVLSTGSVGGGDAAPQGLRLHINDAPQYLRVNITTVVMASCGAFLAYLQRMVGGRMVPAVWGWCANCGKGGMGTKGRKDANVEERTRRSCRW